MAILYLQIACAEQYALPQEAQLRHWCDAALRDTPADAEVTVRIVDEDEIAELNQRYRGKPYATNVLSFPSSAPAHAQVNELGDLVICHSVVEREASVQGKALEAHWAHMVVHGCLHLLGYDHEQDEEAEHMESLETQILLALGFPAPYDDSEISKYE